MFKYRPHRGALEDAMKEAHEFITMDQMFDYIVRSDPFHALQKEDLSITENLGKDGRINWSETRNVLTKRYGKEVYDTPQAIGWCSMEDFYNPAYFTEAKNIYIGGISRHHLLKMLYDAAKPYDKTISIEEAVDALHSTLDTVTQLKGKRLYVNVFGKEFDGTEYDKINGIGLSYHIVTYMRYHLLWGKHPWEQGIMSEQIEPKDDHSPILPFSDPSRLQEIFDKVSQNNKIPDEMIDKENKYDFGQSLAKIEEDKQEKLESFKTKLAAEMKPELEKLYKDVLKSNKVGIVTTPVQNVYKVTCSVGFEIDLILIRATSEMEAWDKFWKHFKNEPNLNHEDFGSKEEYEYVRGYWKKRGSTVSITIEPINTTSDFLYIGGGRSV